MIDTIKTKSAFTLAEVLITLVIIGVVAALTIPNIIYETKKKEYSARLKKFYSTMKQAEQKSAANGKNWDYWAMSSLMSESGPDYADTFMNEYLLPYISYHKIAYGGFYKNIYLNDGSYFSIRKSACMDFYFDVNGDKNPNESGRDIFYFVYCPSDYGVTGVFLPLGVGNGVSRTDAFLNCKSSSANCGALLMVDGWEFKSDYPYRL